LIVMEMRPGATALFPAGGDPDHLRVAADDLVRYQKIKHGL